MHRTTTANINILDAIERFPHIKFELDGNMLKVFAHDLMEETAKRTEERLAAIMREKADKLVDSHVVMSRLNVSRATLERMADRGEIHKVYVGGGVKYAESEVNSIINRSITVTEV